MIEIEQELDLDSISYDTGIEIKIIPKYFDHPKSWTRLSATTFNDLMANDLSVAKENLLLVFLYINSYIGCRKRDDTGKDVMENPQNSPEAFYRNLHSMSTDLSMSRETINKCIKYLVDEKILIKKTVGSVKAWDKAPQNVPNIYVLNNDRCNQEIEWALNKMKESYKVDLFDETTGGIKK